MIADFNMHNATVVHDINAIAALVAAGIADCYLVKDETGCLIGVFRSSTRLDKAVQALQNGSLELNINEYWDAEFQASTAQSDRWPHEEKATNR